MDHKIFAGLDPYVVLYAAAMAFVASGLNIWQERNAQRVQGLPLSSWLSGIPDTLIGMFFGTALGVFVPPHVPLLNNLSGVTAIVGGVGIGGRRRRDGAWMGGEVVEG